METKEEQNNLDNISDKIDIIEKWYEATEIDRPSGRKFMVVCSNFYRWCKFELINICKLVRDFIIFLNAENLYDRETDKSIEWVIFVPGIMYGVLLIIDFFNRFYSKDYRCIVFFTRIFSFIGGGAVFWGITSDIKSGYYFVLAIASLYASVEMFIFCFVRRFRWCGYLDNDQKQIINRAKLLNRLLQRRISSEENQEKEGALEEKKSSSIAVAKKKITVLKEAMDDIKGVRIAAIEEKEVKLVNDIGKLAKKEKKINEESEKKTEKLGLFERIFRLHEKCKKYKKLESKIDQQIKELKNITDTGEVSFDQKESQESKEANDYIYSIPSIFRKRIGERLLEEMRVIYSPERKIYFEEIFNGEKKTTGDGKINEGKQEEQSLREKVQKFWSEDSEGYIQSIPSIFREQIGEELLEEIREFYPRRKIYYFQNEDPFKEIICEMEELKAPEVENSKVESPQIKQLRDNLTKIKDTENYIKSIPDIFKKSMGKNLFKKVRLTFFHFSKNRKLFDQVAENMQSEVKEVSKMKAIEDEIKERAEKLLRDYSTDDVKQVNPNPLDPVLEYIKSIKKVHAFFTLYEQAKQPCKWSLCKSPRPREDEDAEQKEQNLERENSSSLV